MVSTYIAGVHDKPVNKQDRKQKILYYPYRIFMWKTKPIITSINHSEALMTQS